MFDLVPATGYDEAWSFLMKPDRFFARFGPTTVERQDPLFHISKTCCWWSGNSWPYATSQTLSALARTLQNPQRKPPIGPEDYSTLLASFARTHRRDGLPYLGEACDPDTGSWEGHDAPGHSDHYFHSSFCDLVISGLMGLRVDAPGLPSNEVLVAPLIPDTWSHAALHGASVRGRKLSILWDRSGDLYGLGKGLFVLVDGKTVGSAPTPRAHLRVTVEPADPMEPSARSMNFAVNNDGAPYPRLSSSAASSTAREPLWAINDGNIWYHSEPPNRWTTGASRSTRDWVDIDLGTPRDLVSIRVCLVDDGAKGPAQLPSDLDVEVEVEGTWRSLDAIDPETARPVGHRPTTVAFAPRPVRRFRIVLEHPPGVSVGMSEVEAWGPAVPKFESPSPPSHNLARDQGVRITASHTYRSDSTQAVADGVVQFRPAPANRWTSYESPSAEDWLEFDFGREFELNRAELAFFDDGAGVHAPDEYHLERWTGTGWASISGQVRSPGAPAGGQFNSVKFPTIRTSKLRLVSRHRPGVSSGLTEVELYRDAHP
jgi:hypothetical protein